MVKFLKALAVLVILLAPLAADSRTDDINGAWAVWQEIGPLTNCSAASINVAKVCGDTYGFKTEGYNILTLEIAYTKSAGTGWQFYLETCREGHTTSDCTDAADWHQVVITQAAAGTGVSLTADPIYHVAAATDRITYSIGINYRRVRLNGFVATGSPDANDKVTVSARVGWIPAY